MNYGYAVECKDCGAGVIRKTKIGAKKWKNNHRCPTLVIDIPPVNSMGMLTGEIKARVKRSKK